MGYVTKKYGEPVYWRSGLFVKQTLAFSRGKNTRKSAVKGYKARFDRKTKILTFIPCNPKKNLVQFCIDGIELHILRKFEDMLYEMVVLEGTALEAFIKSRIWMY